MKYVYYMSSANSELFPNNTSVQFSNNIHPQYLDSLPSGDLEAAVKLISFDNTRRFGNLRRVERIALKSNLSSKIISSGDWDNIIAWFSLGTSSFKKKILTYEFKNPSFFPTTKELLSRATFELVNLYNNSKADISNNSNSFIQIIVRTPKKRMKQPFYIHLDSACKVSKSFFPTNSTTDFTIKLPQRMEFQKDWIIALKNFSLPNSLFNVFDCYITVGTQIYRLTDGIFTDGEIIVRLNSLLAGIMEFRGIQHTAPNGGKVFVRAKKNLDEGVIFNSNLSLILGLSSDQQSKKMKAGDYFLAEHKINASAILPKQLIVSCDIIENSYFGGEMKQILRIVNLPDNNEDSFYNFEFSTNEYLKLESKSLDKIMIKISDLNGRPLRLDGNLSTRLQILFVNINNE